MRLALIAVTFAVCSAGLRAQDDYRQAEFAERPAPAWVRMIDQGAVDPALSGLSTPDGVRVELAAAEPAVVNPVGMTFAEDGTPWVLEWTVAPEGRHVTYEVTFRDGSKATVNRMTKDTRDLLKTLSDEDGDGRWDAARVVMDDLEIPSSVMLHEGWVYLSSIGHVVRRRVGEGGVGFNREEEIVRGLCGFHHHQASGLTISPDGWLFVSSGDDDNHGEGSDGSRATVLRTGAIFRMKPDGSRLSEYARGFRNPYRDVAFDATFNMFHVDNDQEDGSKFTGVRLMHVLEGADFGWRLADGAVCCVTDAARGAVFGELPGKYPSLLKTGRGAPAGLLIYQGTAFPEFFRGLLIYPDVFRKRVRAYEVRRSGSTFEVVSQFDLMRSDDPLFRPCQALAGPDGGIYIVDWRTDSGGAGRLWGDGKSGRIYRLSWCGLPGEAARPLASIRSWQEIPSADDATLMHLLESADFQLRLRAQRELVGRGPSRRGALLALALDPAKPAPSRAAALGGACQLYDAQVETALVRLLADGDLEIRRLAAEEIGRFWSPRDGAASALFALATALEDPHPAVQRSAALALGTLLGQVAPSRRDLDRSALLEKLGAAYSRCSADDRLLSDGILRGIERCGEPGIGLLVEMARSDDERTRERAVSGLESVRTAEGARGLDQLLAEEPSRLAADQLRRVLAAYRHILVEPPVSTKAVAQWLDRHRDADASLQVAGLETLGLTKSTDAAQLADLAIQLLRHPDPRVRLSVIQSIGDAGLIPAVRPLAEALADTSRSTEERRAIVASLSKLRSRPAPFTGVRSPPGVEQVTADLGRVASDPAAGEVRADVLNLLAQLDYGQAMRIADRWITDKNLALSPTAIDVLGANPAAAANLAQRFLEGDIDRSLLPRLASVLQMHAQKEPDGEWAPLLARLFKDTLLVSTDPAEVLRVESLVQTTGDPLRGRSVYLDSKRSQCASCHKLEGVGGQVGPDLSKSYETQTVGKLLESMLDPSKEIKEGYPAFTAVTRSGQVYRGLKIEGTAEGVVLRDAQGRDVRIAAAELEELIQDAKSLMPDGVAAQLSYQEFVDLVAFLKDRPAQEGLRGLMLQAWAAGPFGPSLDDEEGPLPTPDPRQSVARPGGPPVPWQLLSVEGEGRFNLRSAFPVENASAFVLVYVHAPAARQSEWTLWFDDAVKLWVNGKPVFESRDLHADQRVAFPLEAGRNTLLFRVVNGPGDFELKIKPASAGLTFSTDP
jgi:putative membrane-bound dehydrogenase-like protein